MIMVGFILVGIGGFFGAVSRYKIAVVMNKKTKTALPSGTLTVNILGSFLLGIMTGLSISHKFELLFGTGFMGAFTTFSTFKLENIQMHANKQGHLLVLYLFLTYGVGLTAAFIGLIIGSRLA